MVVLADKRTPLNPATSTKDADEGEPVSLAADPLQWVRTLSRNYSWQLLVMVFCTSHLLKGFVAGGGLQGLVGKPAEFLFGQLGVPAGRMQMLKAAAASPWSLKPVMALLSDACPICGYKKMPYVVLTTCFSFGAALAVGLGLVKSVFGIVACLFLMFWQVSTVDLLVVAKQSEEVKQKAHLGPQLFTFTWVGINLGQIAGVVALGPLIHYYGPRLPYLIAAPIIALVLWPTLANCLGERRVALEERCPNLRLVILHPILCMMTLGVGLMVLALLVCTFLLTERHLMFVAVSICVFLPSAFSFFIRREIAGPIIFYFLLGILSFNADGALFYFYTDSYEAFPSGPHFTAYFYTTGLGAAGFIGVFVGFVSGQWMFKDWSYRSILKLTVMLRVLTQLLLVPVLIRWTDRQGLSDKVWVLAVSMLDSMVFAWRWIPREVMSAHLTPKGMEATMLGLSAGTFNMAVMLSSYMGGFVLHHLGVRPTGQRHDVDMFQDLWKVQVVVALAPCAMLFFLPSMIPGSLQTEALLTERPDSATYDSPYELMKRRSAGDRESGTAGGV